MSDLQNAKYKPEPGTQPDCSLCDYENCHSKWKFQRGKQDFSVTSGRCPRLPDEKGRYDSAWYDLND